MTDVFLLFSGLLAGAVRVLVGLFLVHRLLSISVKIIVTTGEKYGILAAWKS